MVFLTPESPALAGRSGMDPEDLRLLLLVGGDDDSLMRSTRLLFCFEGFNHDRPNGCVRLRGIYLLFLVWVVTN